MFPRTFRTSLSYDWPVSRCRVTVSAVPAVTTLTALAIITGGCTRASSPGPVAPVEPGAITQPACPTEPASSSTAPVQVAVAPEEPVPEARGRAAPLASSDERVRADAMKAMDEGRFGEARGLLSQLLDRYPGNVTLVALHRAAGEAIEHARDGALATLDNFPARPMPAPPWKRALLQRVTVSESRLPRLVKVKQEKNRVIDDEAWFAANQIALPVYTLPNERRGVEGDLPEFIPLVYGKARLQQAINHGDHIVLFYGERYVVLMEADGSPLAAYDFGAWTWAPRLDQDWGQFADAEPRWAQLVGDTLIITHAHRTYASSSKGINAFVTALNYKTGELLWRSQPLVSNSVNFLLIDGHLVTGYGFTKEPDFVYVLDVADGATKSKIKVKSGPDYFIRKGSKLFVRTYDTNYEFELR